MEGGEISGNYFTPTWGSPAGVLVDSGIFNMYDGEISGHSNGHGVSVNRGTFTMHDGTISGNTVVGARSGGGVSVGLGTFTMHGGEISGNTAGSSGGGISVGSNSMFVMHGGIISGNTAESGGGGGGGVWGNLTMHGGEIFGNSTNGNGGGVLGNLTMHGGEIFGNSTNGNGGGVSGTVRIANGIIRGSEAGAGLANTAANNGASLNVTGTARIGMFDGDGEFTETGTVFTTDITLHVVNGVVQEVEGDLIVQLAWLRAFAQSGGRYTIELSGDKTIAPTTGHANQSLPTGRTDLSITLRGTGGMRTVGLSGSGSGNLFLIPSGVTLVLDENITLQGRDGNNSRLLAVSGTLVMNEGTRVTGNIGGGGVLVNGGGTLVLDGGVISGNSTTGTDAAGNGGGVNVGNGGTFDMRRGTISGNSGQNGGGVFIASGGPSPGTFRMGNGVIHGSDAAGDLANISRGTGAAAGASLHGTTRYGTFDNGEFTENGTLSTTNYTIEVEDGELLRPLPQA